MSKPKVEVDRLARVVVRVLDDAELDVFARDAEVRAFGFVAPVP